MTIMYKLQSIMVFKKKYLDGVQYSHRDETHFNL